MTTISFIGRKQGSHWSKRQKKKYDDKIERARIGEQEGFSKSQLTLTSLPLADTVYTRLNPERTNRRTLKRVIAAEQCASQSALLLNSAQHFHKYADKTQCFKQWQQAGLSTPRFIETSLWQHKSKLREKAKKILEHHERLYLRTNNEDSGKGIEVLTQQASDKQIDKAINKLRIRSVVNKVSGSRCLLVGSVNNTDPQGISHVFRAHVCCGEILGGYALVGTSPVIHAKDVQTKDWSAFLTYNQRLIKIIQDQAHKQAILTAAEALGADIGAVEFFLVDKKLVFLELNPMWGGTHRFGDAEFMNLAHQHLDRPELKLVKSWLYPVQYYEALYNRIENYFLNLHLTQGIKR